MSARTLFALLIGFALTLAPLGMPAMAAEAPAPASHHGDMAKQGHCDDQPAPDSRDKADKSCCAAMCIAVVVPSAAAKLPVYHAALERPASDLKRRGFLGEIATPPPRSA